MGSKHRINNLIKSDQVRLIGSNGESLGVVTIAEALAKARKVGLDLVEISASTNPPIAKVIDYGKFLYLENKKQKEARAKTHSVEVKSLQVKLGTGEHDLLLKAKKASEWLKEGHRVKIDLFLPGRTKFMEASFLKERMERIFKLIAVDFKIASEPQKSPKGLTSLIERAK